MSVITSLERESIRRCVSSHSVLLLEGPEQSGVVRAVEAILEEWVAEEDRPEIEEMVWGGIYPDLILYDGRELTAEDARNLRQFATSCPAHWDRRFVVISYIHRPHPITMPILLKLVEEPPDHFSVIFTTSNERRVLPTILSRSLRVKIRPSDENEIRWWLRKAQKNEDDLRVKACNGDLSVADSLDLPVVKEWHKDWSAVLAGSDFKKSFLETWVFRLEEASESTQIACWDMLIQMIAEVLDKNRFWVDIGLTGIKARNAAQQGLMNKILSSTMLFEVFAIAKVILNRTKS